MSKPFRLIKTIKTLKVYTTVGFIKIMTPERISLSDRKEGTGPFPAFLLVPVFQSARLYCERQRKKSIITHLSFKLIQIQRRAWQNLSCVVEEFWSQSNARFANRCRKSVKNQ